jgi:hypothetical protein
LVLPPSGSLTQPGPKTRHRQDQPAGSRGSRAQVLNLRRSKVGA